MDRSSRRRNQHVVGFLSVLLCLILALPRPAVAEDARWDAFREALETGHRHHNLWRGSWAAYYTGGLGYNLYQASESDRSATRFDARIGAIKSTLALGVLALTPSPYRTPLGRLEQLEGRRHADPDGAMRDAEALMRETARGENRRRSPSNLWGPVVVNLLGGAIIAFGDNRPDDGAISAATGLLSSSLQLATRPNSVNRARRAGRLEAAGIHHQLQFAATPGGGAAFLQMAW